ncbi:MULTISPECIES: hypothetical protein [unclassified Sulfitobacter]|uniref:hypothetical protein n=1 Tax=unclassified Sulfitobacter TaxID=196795 RepID=UPI0037465F59
MFISHLLRGVFASIFMTSSAVAQHFPNSPGEPPTYPFENWIIASAPAKSIAVGQAYRGVILNPDYSVNIGQLEMLPPADLSEGTDLNTYPSPDGTALLVLATQGTIGYRTAVIDFDQNKVFGTDVIPNDRISGLSSKESWQLGNQVAWSPDSQMVMINRSRGDRQTEAALVNLSDGSVRTITPSLPKGQWAAVEIHTARVSDAAGNHAVNFTVNECYSDDCMNYGPVREAMVSFNEERMTTHLFPTPFQLEPPNSGWLQFSSKPTYEEAVAEALRWDGQIDTRVDIFQASNGWYALTAGNWYDPEIAYATEFKEESGLPSDALLVAGKSYATWVPHSEGQTAPFWQVRVGKGTKLFVDREMTHPLDWQYHQGDFVRIYHREGNMCQVGYHEPSWVPCRNLEAGMEAPIKELSEPTDALVGEPSTKVVVPDTSTANSTDPDMGDGELARMWAWLATNSPSTVEVLGLDNMLDEAEKELTIRVSYLVIMGATYITDSALTQFEDPDVIGDIYKSYVISGGLKGATEAARTAGAGMGTSLLTGIVKDIAASILTDYIMEDFTDLSPDMQVLAKAGVKATIIELINAMEAFADPKQVIWLVLDRAYDMVEIARASKSLANQQDAQLLSVALGVQAATLNLHLFPENPKSREVALQTITELEPRLVDMVGRDDAKEVHEIFSLGMSALRELYKGNTQFAEDLKQDIIARGDQGNWPTLDINDTFTYLVNLGQDAPKRAATMMVNFTDLKDMKSLAAEQAAENDATEEFEIVTSGTEPDESQSPGPYPASINTNESVAESWVAFEEVTYPAIAAISLHLGMEPRSVFSDAGLKTFESKRRHREIMETYALHAEYLEGEKNTHFMTNSSGVPVAFNDYDFQNDLQYMCIPRIAMFAPPRELEGGGTYQSVFGYVGPETYVHFFYGDSNRPGASPRARCGTRMEASSFLSGEYRYAGIGLKMQNSISGEAFDKIIRSTPMAMRFECGPLSLYKEKYGQNQSLACRIYSFDLIKRGSKTPVTTFTHNNGEWSSKDF